jgi:hypothetical protein
MRNKRDDNRYPVLSPEQRTCGMILKADWTPNVPRTWFTPDSGIRWQEVQQLASRYKIRPMVAAAISEGRWDVPSDVRAALEVSAREYFVRVSRQLALLPDLIARASARGLRFVIIKGMALSLWLYRDPFIRESFDLDVLVSRSDFEAMLGLLREIGFRDFTPQPPLSPRQEAILSRIFPARKLIHPDTGAAIDVHWALDYNPGRKPIGFEQIWLDRSYVQIGRNQVAIPGQRHLLQFLVMHASKHLWERWKWIGDLATIFGRMSAQEILDFRRSQTTRHAAEAFDCSLLLVSIVTGEAIPPGVEAEIRRKPRLVALAKRSLYFASVPMTAEGKQSHTASRTLHVALRSRDIRIVAYELRFLMHAESEWRGLQLPDALIPVYYLVRLAGFVRRKLV